MRAIRAPQKVVLIVVCAFCANAVEIVELTAGTFDKFLGEHPQMLVVFGELEKGGDSKHYETLQAAADDLKDIVPVAHVDQSEQELVKRYEVPSMPVIMWFDGAEHMFYAGAKTSEGMVAWCRRMSGPAVRQLQATPDAPSGSTPQVILYSSEYLSGFEDAAKSNRQNATWYFVKVEGKSRIVVRHRNEDAIETSSVSDDAQQIKGFFGEHALAIFGPLDEDTFPRFMASSRGFVWVLHEDEELESFDELGNNLRKKFGHQVAKVIRPLGYNIGYIDVGKWAKVIDSRLGVRDFPRIAVQKKPGDRTRYVHAGPMEAQAIIDFVKDVHASKIEPFIRSEPVPANSGEHFDYVHKVVGKTLEEKIFSKDKDALLLVTSTDSKCGRCKAVEKDFKLLGAKVRAEGLDDITIVGRFDSALNECPAKEIRWKNVPSLFHVKAGSREVQEYTGGSETKEVWKWLKRSHSQSLAIEARLAENKRRKKKAEL